MPKKPAKKAAPAPASPEVTKKTVAPAAVPPVTAAAAKSAPPQPKKKPAAKAVNGAAPTPAPVAPVALPAAPGPKETTFALDLPEAKQVWLTGQFNAWSPTAQPMRRTNNGHWEAKIALPPGRYEYKFVADGNWLADPKATENVYNEHGTLNSVVTVLS